MSAWWWVQGRRGEGGTGSANRTGGGGGGVVAVLVNVDRLLLLPFSPLRLVFRFLVCSLHRLQDEGNELFKDGNYQWAVGRYTKALTHSAKFFDLNDDDKAEVEALKLSLFLNLAQCFIKLEMWQKVTTSLDVYVGWVIGNGPHRL